MSLNIKDEEAHRLAQAIAKETGETMTHVVVEALRARHRFIEKQRSRAGMEELVSIAKRSASFVKAPYKDHGEFLYDEHGLPK